MSRIAAKNSFALIVAALHEGALPEIDGVTSFSNRDETDFIRTTEQPERCTNLDFKTGHFQLRELFLKSMALRGRQTHRSMRSQNKVPEKDYCHPQCCNILI